MEIENITVTNIQFYSHVFQPAVPLSTTSTGQMYLLLHKIFRTAVTWGRKQQ